MLNTKFRKWLIHNFKTEVTTAYGKLANDICRDPNKPDFSSLEEWKAYLISQKASDNTLNIFINAYASYIKDMKLYCQ